MILVIIKGLNPLFFMRYSRYSSDGLRVRVCMYVTMCKMSVIRKDEMRTGRIFPNFETLALFKYTHWLGFNIEH